MHLRLVVVPLAHLHEAQVVMRACQLPSVAQLFAYGESIAVKRAGAREVTPVKGDVPQADEAVSNPLFIPEVAEEDQGLLVERVGLVEIAPVPKDQGLLA